MYPTAGFAGATSPGYVARFPTIDAPVTWFTKKPTKFLIRIVGVPLARELSYWLTSNTGKATRRGERAAHGGLDAAQLFRMRSVVAFQDAVGSCATRAAAAEVASGRVPVPSTASVSPIVTGAPLQAVIAEEKLGGPDRPGSRTATNCPAVIRIAGSAGTSVSVTFSFKVLVKRAKPSPGDVRLGGEYVSAGGVVSNVDVGVQGVFTFGWFECQLSGIASGHTQLVLFPGATVAMACARTPCLGTLMARPKNVGSAVPCDWSR
jgi:hypothetical protein